MAISAFFLYWVLKDIEFSILWQETVKANYWLILPGVGAYFIGLWVRAWRWHYLLRPIKAVPTRKMFPIVAMGYAGNNIFPARAGEVLRAVVLKSREDVPISASLAIVRGLHARWVVLFDTLTPDQWSRTGVHSERGEIPVSDFLVTYSNHCDIHIDQIKRVLAAGVKQ